MGAVPLRPRLSGRTRVLRVDDTTALTLDLPLQFMRAMWELVHALQTTSKRMRRDLGVTGPQRLVIRVIGLCPDISAGALARFLHIDPSTLTGVLQRMEQQRLVRRSADPADGRRVTLRLTAAGTRINAAMSGTVEAAVRATLAAAAPRDQGAATRLLAALVGRMGQGASRPEAAPPARRRRR